jgi:hypothetical protein
MSKRLDVPRDLLFNLAAKEGGWRADGLDHNMPLNNPFGVNVIKDREAAGNRGYPSVDDAIADWERQYGDRIRGARSQEDMVNALLRPTPPALPYNVKDPGWETKFYNINVQKWREACGVPR